MFKRSLVLFCIFAVIFGSAASADSKVKFTLWHSYVGADQRAEFMADRLAAFSKANPDILIDEQQIPRDQYQTKLKTMAAAGSLPDAFVIWPNAMCIEFANAGLLADINDVLDKNPAWKNAFSPRALGEFTVKGKTYSAALGVSLTSVVYYNKAIFAKYNVQYPKTYAELKDAIKVFNKNGVIPIAYGNKPLWPAQSTIFSCLADRVTGSQWLTDVLAKKNGAKFTDASFIQALNIMKELNALGAFNKDYNTIDNVQMRRYYYKGEAAMMIDGAWAFSDMIANAPDDVQANTELAVFPDFGGKGDPNVMSGVSSTGVAIHVPFWRRVPEALPEVLYPHLIQEHPHRPEDRQSALCQDADAHRGASPHHGLRFGPQFRTRFHHQRRSPGHHDRAGEADRRCEPDAGCFKIGMNR
ncbi:MAG: extracellular solute-binding protein [Spirochaetes bacterium]|nr:extracellular solute-binding protein [Spirochaetota bacterium]